MIRSLIGQSGESRRQSFGESIKGMVFGIVLFGVSFPVLWLNERNSAETIAGLNHLFRETTTVESNDIRTEFEGKPVHLIGRAETDETIRDPEFGVTANVIKLVRKVEMYQWQQTEQTEDDRTTYTYKRVWSDYPIDSRRFEESAEHSNPPMPYQSQVFQAKDVTLGAFKLSSFLVAQMRSTESLELDAAQRSNLPGRLRTILKDDGPGYYQGDPGSPQIGDLRIRFLTVPQTIVSIVAQQSGNSFEPFTAKNGKQFGILETGRFDKAQVVGAERGRNSVRTWMFRGLGCGAMFLGLCMILKPLSLIAGSIPLLGGVVRAGMLLISLVFAIGASSMTIAVAWIAYRPSISVPLALVSVCLVGFGFARLWRFRSKPGNPQPASASLIQSEPMMSALHSIQKPEAPVPLKFSCPGCGQHISCDSTYAGLQLQCPICNGSLVVPGSLQAETASTVEQLETRQASGALVGGEVAALALSEGQPASYGTQSASPSFDDMIHSGPNPGATTQSYLESQRDDTRQAGMSAMYDRLRSTADEVRALPEFKQPRPTAKKGLKAFFTRAGHAIRLIFTEKELITFSLLQWSSIGIAYYIWVQVLGWIPEETWASARNSEDVSMVDVAVLVWSLLCIGLAAFPLGMLSGCMGAVHFLNRQGQNSTIARCLKIVMPHAFRLWAFSWIDGVITCRQIMERLPKKKDKNSPRVNRALSEAIYYAWKLATAGVLPGLLLGKGMIAASKDSVLLLKNRFIDMALLRVGYSMLCWVVGVLAYIGTGAFLYLTGFFERTRGAAEGVQVHQLFLHAGVPLLIAVGVVLVFLRPLFVISLCEIYAEETERRGESMVLEEGPGRGKSAMVAFGVLALIVATGGFHVKSFVTGRSEVTQVTPVSEQSISPAGGVVRGSENFKEELQVVNAGIETGDKVVSSKPSTSLRQRGGYALQFDGKSNWLELAPINWEVLGAFTVEVWVRDWNGGIVAQGAAGDPENSLYLGLGRPAGDNRYSPSGWESNARNKEFRFQSPPTNRWIHVAMVFDGKNQSFYLDGERKHQVAASRPGPFDMRRSLTLARRGDGLLRSVRVSSTARYDSNFRPADRWTTDGETLLLLEASDQEDNKVMDLSTHGQKVGVQGKLVFVPAPK